MQRNLRRLSAAALALGLAVTSVVGWAQPVSAAPDKIQFRKIDTSNFPEVKLFLLPPANAQGGESIKLSENGVPVTDYTAETLTEASQPIGIVLMLDTSDSAKDRGLLQAQQAAARALIADKAPNEKYGLVAYNGTARQVIGLTSDSGALLSAIDGLKAAGEPALWDGIQAAGRMLDGEPLLQANIILLSVAPNEMSEVTQAQAATAVNASKAAFFAVGVTTRNEDVNQGPLTALATRSGGQFLQTNDPTELKALLQDVQRNLQSQMLVSFTSTQNTSLTLAVSMGEFKGGAEASPNTVSLGSDIAPPATNLAPPPLLTGKIGLLIIVAVVLAAVGLLGYGLMEIYGNDRNQLAKALRPYSDEPQEEERDFSKLADSEIIKKAVASTAKMAQDRGLLQFTQARLEQADLPLRPAEALFFTGVIAAVAMVLGLIFADLIGLVAAGMVFLYLPFAVTAFLAKRRKKKFTSQLPDMLQLLAGSMRAGYSLVQGLDAVSRQAEAPMGPELQRAMAEARLGRPVDEALQDLSDRMGSDDFEWAVMAIKIQRDVGGNLAELLMTVSETMIARERLRREVKGLTAEGRMSAIILVGLPPGVGLLVMVLNPEYMQPMISNFIGQMALVGAVILMGIGWFVMQKMMEIEA